MAKRDATRVYTIQAVKGVRERGFSITPYIKDISGEYQETDPITIALRQKYKLDAGGMVKLADIVNFIKSVELDNKYSTRMLSLTNEQDVIYKLKKQFPFIERGVGKDNTYNGGKNERNTSYIYGISEVADNSPFKSKIVSLAEIRKAQIEYNADLIFTSDISVLNDNEHYLQWLTLPKCKDGKARIIVGTNPREIVEGAKMRCE